VELVLLYDSAARGEEDELALGLLRPGNESGQRFLVVEIEQVRDRAALGGPAAFGKLIGFELIDLAGAGEEQQPVVGRDRDQLLDEVFLAGGRANLATAAAPLRAIERKRGALDIAA